MKKIVVSISILFVCLGLFNFAFTHQAEAQEPVDLYFFYGETCPYCKKAAAFLERLEVEYPALRIHSYEVFGSKQNADLLLQFLESCGEEEIIRVPVIFVGQEVIKGYFSDDITGRKIRDAVEECFDDFCLDPLDKVDKCQICQCQGLEGEDCPCQECSCSGQNQDEHIIKYPILGNINLSKLSLPVLTVAVAALDGFNPCAMWILLFLLALLINLGSRRKIWLIAGTFILASGLVYYLLLTAWLNLFLAVSYVSLTKIIIGLAAVFFGLWQIKRYFAFKPGVCEVTPEGSRLENKMKKRAERAVNNPVMIFSVLGVIVLALAVNLIEFFCSAGLPAIYTRILSLNKLDSLSYHFYLLLYTFIFMADDIIIFAIALITLRKIGFSDKYNKWSTLIGGILVFVLGLLLIFKPDFLVF